MTFVGPSQPAFLNLWHCELVSSLQIQTPEWANISASWVVTWNKTFFTSQKHLRTSSSLIPPPTQLLLSHTVSKAFRSESPLSFLRENCANFSVWTGKLAHPILQGHYHRLPLKPASPDSPCHNVPPALPRLSAKFSNTIWNEKVRSNESLP